MGVDFSGSRVVASRNTLLHDGATNATWSGCFDLGTVPAGRSRVPGAHLGGSLATPNFREFPFRNCLENSLRPLSAPLWRQDAPEWELLWLLLTALKAPIRDLSRISKQFLHTLG